MKARILSPIVGAVIAVSIDTILTKSRVKMRRYILLLSSGRELTVDAVNLDAAYDIAAEHYPEAYVVGFRVTAASEPEGDSEDSE